MWTVEPGFYQSSLIECFKYQGVLVKVHPVGTYPKLRHHTGAREQDVPRIEILLKHDIRNGTEYYNGAVIKTLMPCNMGGRVKELVVWEDSGKERADPHEYIGKAKGQLPSAVLQLKNMVPLFEEAYARIGQGVIYKEPFLTRMEYERACSALQVDIMTDIECHGDGVRYGVYSFPEYAPDFILKMKLAGLRLRGIEQMTSPSLHASELAYLPGRTRH